MKRTKIDKAELAVALVSTVNQLRMHAGASDTHIPRPLLNRAADEIDALLAILQELVDGPAGGLGLHERAVIKARAHLTRSTDRRE